MNQSRQMISVLKRQLRSQGVTYKDVAGAIGLSEASVKRLFAEHTFSLERFEQVCGVLDLEIADLLAIMEKDSANVEQLSTQQETEIAADIKLLLVANSLLNHWQFGEITQTYKISEHEGIQLMAKLDRMGLIQLLPGNRVKLMVARTFSWIPHGPIQRFFEKSVQAEFLQASFTGPGETRIFINGMLSRRANKDITNKMNRLLQDFDQHHKDDESLPLDERYGTSMLMAVRPWELKLFDSLRRVKNKKPF